MGAAHAAGRNPLGESELVDELTALGALLHCGPPESQTACRAGVLYHPGGVLVEQLLADITVVFSPPKVGSSTITATLNRHPAVRPEATHLHNLSTPGLAYIEELIAKCSHPNVRFLRELLVQGRATRALLAANRALRTSGLSAVARKPFLIAGARDPMALYLSGAFESWWVQVDRPEALSSESVRDWVFNDPWARMCDEWYTDELYAVSGVDVYARPFRTDRGWDLYENDAARVLVIRQENLDRLPDALGALYGLDPAGFVVESCNVAASKAYAGHYARVKRELRLTEPELDRVYGSRYVQHFYTPQEIARFRHRWSTGSDDPEITPAVAAIDPEPAGDVGSRASDRNAPPHIWVCRPCWRCEQRLNSIPGLQHACATQADRIGQLEIACRAAGPQGGAVAGPLRALARRIPMPLRSLGRRLLRRLRAASC